MSAVLCHSLALHAILLARNFDGGFLGSIQPGEGGSVGDWSSSIVPECDVLDQKWDGEFAFVFAARRGVFANSE